jgi:hypothetical protein
VKTALPKLTGNKRDALALCSLINQPQKIAA